MIPRLFLPLVSALSLFSLAVQAQTITVTTHVSACKATYTSGGSTTVIQSTVTVQPTPLATLPDDEANGGTPFVIRLEQVDLSGYPDQQGAAPYWITYNGNTTTDPSLAARYYIDPEGQLRTANGSYVSTNYGVVDQAFGTTNYVMPINTTFSVNNGMINWTNPEFTNGTAQFYKLPPGLLDNAQILVKFLGSMEPERSWSPVILFVQRAANILSMSTSSSAGALSGSSATGLVNASSAPAISSASFLLSASESSAMTPSSMGVSVSSGGAMSSVMGSMTTAMDSMTSAMGSMASSIGFMPSSMGSEQTSIGVMSSSAGLMSSGTPILSTAASSTSPGEASMSSNGVMTSAVASMSGPGVSSASASLPSLLSSIASSLGSSASSALAASSPDAMASSMSASSVVVPIASSSMPSSVMTPSTGVSSPPFSIPPLNASMNSVMSSSMMSSSMTATSPTSVPVTNALSAASSQTASPPSNYSSPISSVSISGIGPVIPPSSTTALSSSGVTSTPTPTPITASTYTCPADNGDTVVDSLGYTYTVGCGNDTNGGGNAYTAASSFNDCFTTCDMVYGCVAFTYSGGTDGQGAGTCYIKVGNTNPTFVYGGTGFVAGIRASGQGYDASAPSLATTSSTTPTGSPIPTCPTMDGQTITDGNGAQYSIKCGADSSGGLLTTYAVQSRGILECAEACDRTATCAGFTYSGDATMTMGTCYLKDPVGVYASAGSTIATGTLFSAGNSSAGSASGSSSVSSSSVASSSSSASSTGGGAGTGSSTSSASAASATSTTARTACDFGDGPNADEDDSYCEIDLPFSMDLYGGSSSKTFASSNGILSIITGSSQYDSNPPLPNSALPSYTALAFFDDLYLSASAGDGVYYTLTATTALYEFVLIRAGTTETYDFSVSYDSANPGVVVYKYNIVGQGDNGEAATVGIQGLDASGNAVATTFSHQTQVITPGLTVTCNTNTNTCTSS